MPKKRNMSIPWLVVLDVGELGSLPPALFPILLVLSSASPCFYQQHRLPEHTQFCADRIIPQHVVFMRKRGLVFKLLTRDVKTHLGEAGLA